MKPAALRILLLSVLACCATACFLLPRADEAQTDGPPERVLRLDFPEPAFEERTWVVMERPVESNDPRDWRDLGAGKRAVRIAPGHRARLILGSAHRDLAPLADLPPGALESLRFFHSEGGALAIDDRSLIQISLIEGLCDLDLTGARVSAPGFLVLRHLRELRSLAIGRSPGLDASALDHLAHLPELEALRIEGMTLGEAAQALGRMPVLKELDLRMLTMSSQAWEAIAGLKQLRTLRLSLTNATADGRRMQRRYKTGPDAPPIESLDFSALLHMPNLRAVGLNWTRLSMAEARVVARLDGLEELDLHGEVLDNDVLTTVGAMTGLRRLALSVDCRSDLSLLAGLENLEALELRGPLPTSHSLSAMIDRPLGELALLDMGYETEGVFEAVGRLKSLRGLTLLGDNEARRGFPAEAVAHLRGLENLERLVIEGFACEEVDEARIAEILGALPSLRILDIRDKAQQTRMSEYFIRLNPALVFTDIRPRERYSSFGP